MDDTPAERRALGVLPLTWEEWKRGADSIRAVAAAAGRDIPERELGAHLAAAGAGPDAIDGNTAKIEKRLREDKEARARAAERQRRAEEPALAAREAERLRLEEKREQDLSEGGGMKL